MNWQINEKYLQTYIPNKWGRGLGITNFTIDYTKLLKLNNYKLVVEPLLGIPTKQVFYPFPQSWKLGRLV